MALGTRAISRIEGAGNSGFKNAKKVAELFISSNTNDAGVISNPEVYQNVIDDILAPYAETIDGQNLISKYNNKIKALEFKNNSSETTVSALREKEYASWYVDDDGADDTSFRNPAWVAQMTSESLDMIVAETALAITQARENDLPTADLNTYLNGLITRADRMRQVSGSFQDGTEASLDGYGYFVDSDPNTGEMRGASFMPTDAEFGGLSKNKMRTNSTIAVGDKSIPVYLPFVTTDTGEAKSMLGGVEYLDDGDVLYASGSENVSLTDRTSYQGVSSKITLNNIYQSFNGKVNVDGSFKKDYVYVGGDNTIYKFSDDNVKGMAFLKNMKEAGVVGENIPRLNPADVADFYTQPLPDDSKSLALSAGSDSRLRKYQNEANIMQTEIDRKENRSLLQEFGEGFGGLVSKGASKVKSFFGNKNKQNKPDTPGQTIDGVSSAPDVIDSGGSFFAGKVT